MKDRVASGFISGLIAATFMNVIDWTGYLLGFYQERLLDWAAISLFGRLTANIYEMLFAQVSQIIFGGFIGMAFALVLLKLTSGHLYLKAWILSVTVWFLLYALSIAIGLPTLETHTFAAVISHFLSASLYGFVLAFVLNKLDARKNNIF